jgi:hypothetical protein
MRMRIIEARNDGLSVEIDHTGLRADCCFDFVRSANGEYAISANGYRLALSTGAIQGQHVSAPQYDVSR